MSNKRVLILYFIAFIVLLPVALSINYWHNDEWVYYPNIENLSKGNLSLHPLTAPNFYSIGILAVMFAKVFGITKLPVLTLLVSVLAILVLFLILTQRRALRNIDAFLISLLLFVNPLFQFTTWGFMTDNYFLLFLLLSIYLLSDSRTLNCNFSMKVAPRMFFAHLVVLCTYFARQLGLLIPVATTLWFTVNKRYRYAVFEFIFFIALSMFHFLLFPKSKEALETKVIATNLTYFRYIFALSVAIGIYLILFLAPLLSVKIRLNNTSVKRLILFALTSFALLVSIQLFFKETGWVRGKLYYLRYSVQRNGFFVENLHGSKENIPLSNQTYALLEIVIKVAFVVFVSYIVTIAGVKKIFNFYSILIALYVGSLFLVEKVYDRYLIPLFPLAIISTTPLYAPNGVLTALRRSLLILFVVCIAYYSYNFVADYVITNRYVWNKSVEISIVNGVMRSEIVATDAWRYLYPRTSVKYKFTYDSPDKQDYSVNWDLVDKKTIKYPASLLDNTIYLYRLKNPDDTLK